jgi:hypothetical protein
LVCRDDYEAGDERNAWLEEPIELYKKFIQVDRKEARYSIMLADPENGTCNPVFTNIR